MYLNTTLYDPGLLLSLFAQSKVRSASRQMDGRCGISHNLTGTDTAEQLAARRASRT